MKCTIGFLKEQDQLLFWFFMFLFLLVANKSNGQVVNDNIENRIQLLLNTPVSSSTTGCTLQWECLEHKLTKKCIQYHNDQWFFFQASNLKKYYVNISKQKCRDLRGVQLLVIDGKACDPENYKIVECISLGNQDNIFIELKALENQKEYLVLVDGYLHDFCSFQIEFSDQPKGIPLAEQGLVSMKTKRIADYHIEISWSVPDSIALLLQHYEIYRRHETSFSSEKIHEVNQGINTVGAPRLDYVVDEILPDYGVFFYTIVGVGNQGRIMITKKLIQYPRINTFGRDLKHWIEIDLYYKKETKLKISIYDNSNYDLLYWCNFNYSSENRSFEYYIRDYIEDGISIFRIDIENLETLEKKSHIIAK